jgi:hypothetical protein
MTRARSSSESASHKFSLHDAWPWIIRFVGITIVLWETILEHADRPSLLLLAAGMIGLPEVLRLERK